jgi:hypothetical protein
MCRGAAPLSSLWAARPVELDGIGMGHAAAGLLLGLVGLRVVPMVMLGLAWEGLQYVARWCAPASLLGPLADYLRPWGGYFFLMMLGWSVGRLVHWALRRRREAALLAEDPLPTDSSALWPRRPEAVADSAYDSGYGASDLDDELTRNFFGGAAHLDLDDHEADELRAALAHRLAQLRNVQGPDVWDHIGVLENLLARLPPRRARSSSLLVAS